MLADDFLKIIQNKLSTFNPNDEKCLVSALFFLDDLLNRADFRSLALQQLAELPEECNFIKVGFWFAQGMLVHHWKKYSSVFAYLRENCKIFQHSNCSVDDLKELYDSCNMKYIDQKLIFRLLLRIENLGKDLGGK